MSPISTVFHDLLLTLLVPHRSSMVSSRHPERSVASASHASDLFADSLCSLRRSAVKELVTDANFDCTDEGIVRD